MLEVLINMNTAERNAKIALLRQKGGTFESVGKAFGMTGEAARQAISKHHALVEDLQKGGLRGHGLDTRSMRVLRPCMGIKPPTSPTLDELKKWLPEHPDWRRSVRSAPNGGKTTVRNIEEFAERHGITLHKEGGIRTAGVPAWLCSALEIVTGIDNPTKDELKTWFRKNAGWENTKAISMEEAGSIKEYAVAAGIIKNPFHRLSVRAYNCMRLVCPLMTREGFPIKELRAWFAEQPLWLQQITTNPNCGVKTEKEIIAFVVANNLASLPKALPREVYGLLYDFLHCCVGPCRDMSYTGLRAWFADKTDWRETLRKEYGYRGGASIRAVEEYVGREKLAETH